MKVTFIIKKAAKRYDTESMATIYVRFRNGRQLDSVAPTQLAINPNLWDDKDECVKTKAVCNEEMRTHINEEIRQLKTYIEKVYQQEKEAIDKEWLKTTLDKFYHPEKYFLPEEVVIKPTIGELFDEFLNKHPLSEVRKKNFRVVKRALLRYVPYVHSSIGNLSKGLFVVRLLSKHHRKNVRILEKQSISVFLLLGCGVLFSGMAS